MRGSSAGGSGDGREVAVYEFPGQVGRVELEGREVRS